MSWATLSAAANRVAYDRLGSVSVIAGAVTGRGFLKQNSEMLLGDQILSIEYALTVLTSAFGALTYGDYIIVDGVSYSIKHQPMRLDDGEFCVVPLSRLDTDTPLSGALSSRHDFASPYDYCGTAPAGSAESATVWTITRIAVASNGTTTTGMATGASWTGRASATYS